MRDIDQYSRQKLVNVSVANWADGGAQRDEQINAIRDVAGMTVAVIAGTDTEEALPAALLG